MCFWCTLLARKAWLVCVCEQVCLSKPAGLYEEADSVSSIVAISYFPFPMTLLPLSRYLDYGCVQIRAGTRVLCLRVR